MGSFKTSKLPEDYITKEDQKAFNGMRNGKDKVLLFADKGNVTVVMEKDPYDRKVRELVKDNSTDH